MTTRSSLSSWLIVSTLSLAALAFAGCSAGADAESGIDGDNEELDESSGAVGSNFQCQNGNYSTGYGDPVRLVRNNVTYYQMRIYTPGRKGFLYASQANASVFTDKGPSDDVAHTMTGYTLTFNPKRTSAVLTWSKGYGRITLSCR